MAKTLTDEDLFPFGRFKDKKMKDVPAWYLDYMRDKDWVKTDYPGLWAYLIEKKEVIDNELISGGYSI